jgi:hypothetical protein
MKTLTQIVLPLAALGALVFGITFLLNYTSSPPSPDIVPAAANSVLTFWEISSNDYAAAPYLKDWRREYELGEEGHFDFWFRNDKPQQVQLGFDWANCQCASAQVGLVPPEVWTEYAKSAAPLRKGKPEPRHPVLVVKKDDKDDGHYPNLPLEFINEKIGKSIRWQEIERKQDITIPAAISTAPNGWQVGIVRINWTGKQQEGKPSIQARVSTQVAGESAHFDTLNVVIAVVPAFNVYSSSTGGPKVDLGEISVGKPAKRDFCIWSSTRSHFPITAALVNNNDCVSLSTPVSLNDVELGELSRNIGKIVHGASRVTVTVSESKEVKDSESKEVKDKTIKRLDLGPLDFFLSVGVEGENKNVPVRGMVRGDISLHSANGADRIDFGAMFLSSQDKLSPKVTLISDQPLFVADHESTPDYLEVMLSPPDKKDDAKEWTLQVRIPKNRLFGDLVNSFVVLKDKSDRRIRIPVIAKAYSR